MVAGVNLVKKHQRRTGNVNTQFGIIEREAPIHVSNVALVCPKCGKPTRVAHRVHADGSRRALCKKCGESHRRDTAVDCAWECDSHGNAKIAERIATKSCPR